MKFIIAAILVSCLNALMYFTYKIMAASLSIGLILTSTGFAQTSKALDPGYLVDYHYQVPNVDQQMANFLMATERTDFARDSVCADRAELWTFMMRKIIKLEVGKVFIHFTEKGLPNEDKTWAYHVAPYVILNGQEMVLDSGFPVFKGKPVPLQEWTKYFGKNDHCKVLDPVNDKGDLALELNNLPSDTDEKGNPLTPLNFKEGYARQYPVVNGATCYLRKVPAAYRYPKDVYAADLALAGQHAFDKFIMKDFDQDEVSFSCNSVIAGSGKKTAKTCAAYLGF